jgi:hypothetical protein
MNDEAVHLLLVRTHQDGTATPARVFNRGAVCVQHWRRAVHSTNGQWFRNHFEGLPREGRHIKNNA